MSYWNKKLPDYLSIVKDESGIPLFEPRPKNLWALLSQTANRLPDTIALTFESSNLTYQELLDKASSVALHLQYQHGVLKGQRVALLLNNSILYPICFFALAKIGAVSVPLNTRLSPNELVYQIDVSGPCIILADKENWKKVSELVTDKNNIKVFVTGNPSENEFDIEELLLPLDKEVEPAMVHEDDACSIFFTSGTTGNPKGAILTHKGLVATGMNFAVTYQLTPKDSTIVMVPLFHITGKLQFLGSIYSGITIHILHHYQTNLVLNTIEKYQPTVLVGVPTMYWFMFSSELFSKDLFSHVRVVLYGGAPAPVDLIKKFREFVPHIKIHNGYGLTEGHGLDTLLPDEDALRKPDSIGLPVPLVEIKVVDENEQTLELNEIGEIIIKGPKIIPGYWENKEATHRAIRNGWLFTGDVGKIDDEGYIYILDRKKDMINRAGEKIYSIEVENILYSHPKVLEAAVVGIPDKSFGEEIKAVIVLKPGSDGTVEEFRNFCSKKLARFKIPKHFEFRNQLPRNPSGKILKRELI